MLRRHVAAAPAQRADGAEPVQQEQPSHRAVRREQALRDRGGPSMANGVNAADSNSGDTDAQRILRVRSAVRMCRLIPPALARREGAQRGARLGRVRARRERASEED